MRWAAKLPVVSFARSRFLGRATKLKLHLSRMLKEHLPRGLREARARRWQENNREAIETYNKFIEKHGLFNDIRGRK